MRSPVTLAGLGTVGMRVAAALGCGATRGRPNIRDAKRKVAEAAVPV